MPEVVTNFEGRGTRILRVVLGAVLFIYYNSMIMAETILSGSFDNVACVECHEKQNNELVKAWRLSIHGKNETKADCVACHGNSHKDAAVHARQDETCIACHEEKSPVVHSYATSKHGLILRLEKKQWDWTQSLTGANYRTPGCAYCHLHAGEHNVSSGVRGADLLDKNEEKLKAVQDATRRVCQDCHAPRYVTRLFENGERMLEIARMKVREARALLEQAREGYRTEELIAAESQYQKMQLHLKNVYLGIAHQSPDYQWWHGHPALDGDLLRIKGAMSELGRIKKINLLQKEKHKK